MNPEKYRSLGRWLLAGSLLIATGGAIVTTYLDTLQQDQRTAYMDPDCVGEGTPVVGELVATEAAKQGSDAQWLADFGRWGQENVLCPKAEPLTQQPATEWPEQSIIDFTTYP